uniref:Rab-GAP TBC domain-containing protein n=1 Tax=Macrostomum lignano TaxID=282301 RepID=A0A1I8IU49_9PLAT
FDLHLAGTSSSSLQFFCISFSRLSHCSGSPIRAPPTQQQPHQAANTQEKLKRLINNEISEDQLRREDDWSQLVRSANQFAAAAANSTTSSSSGRGTAQKQQPRCGRCQQLEEQLRASEAERQALKRRLVESADEIERLRAQTMEAKTGLIQFTEKFFTSMDTQTTFRAAPSASAASTAAPEAERPSAGLHRATASTRSSGRTSFGTGHFIVFGSCCRTAFSGAPQGDCEHQQQRQDELQDWALHQGDLGGSHPKGVKQAPELGEVDEPIPVGVGVADHLADVLLGDLLTQAAHDALELLRADKAVTVLVEGFEQLLKVLGAGRLAAATVLHHADELLEFDGAVAIQVDVLDHVLEAVFLHRIALGDDSMCCETLPMTDWPQQLSCRGQANEGSFHRLQSASSSQQSAISSQQSAVSSQQSAVSSQQSAVSSQQSAISSQQSAISSQQSAVSSQQSAVSSQQSAVSNQQSAISSQQSAVSSQQSAISGTMLSAAGVNSGAGRLRDCWYTSGGGAVRFYPMDPPTMSNRRSVRYLHKFRFGDTYQLKSRSWLLPQFLSGALTMCGVIFTLVGIICLQINKYLRSVMMPIGVGSTGGGLTLILISGFIFVHAFCVIYDDTEHQVGPE